MSKHRLLALAAALCLSTAAQADAPQYSIIDLGVVGGATAPQAMGMSDDGRIVGGRSLGSTALAYS